MTGVPSPAHLCPRCQVNYYTPYKSDGDPYTYPYPALSRIDNETYICSPCGSDEAVRDWQKLPPIPPDQWPVKELASF